MMKTFDELYSFLKENSQEQILNFYNELDEKQKKNLFNQIERIDFKLMEQLYENRSRDLDKKNKAIETIPFKKESDISDTDKKEYALIGEKLIKDGQVAVCQLAGGQGTRLGHNGPKGSFIVQTNPPKSIFEIFADKLKNSYEKYGVRVRWYIMTSEENDMSTKAFFAANNYFDYGEDNIKFFKQSELPILGFDGKILLKEKYKISMAPNGNGGIFEAMHRENIIEDLKKNNIKYLGIGNVDNILNNFLEPSFLGMMKKNEIELGVKTVTKVSPEEKVGVLCKIDGRVGVVEYTEISAQMANDRNENGDLKYGEAYFGTAIYSVDLLKRIVKNLSYHVAEKRATYINENGDEVVSEKPNSYKFEMFIFEGFNIADTYLIYSVKREENFAPIKNKEGIDSPATAIKSYNDYLHRDVR